MGVIVTLAMSPWVETSIANFLPGVDVFVKRLPLTYARLDKYAPKEGSEVADQLGEYSCMKMNAMKEHIEKKYGKGKAWKNIISVGDGEYERAAVQELGSGN